MTIRMKCPNAKCQKVLVVKDELAGKRVRCPACKTSVGVTAPVAPPADVEDFAAAAFSEEPAAAKAAAPAAAPKSTGTIDFNCYYCDAELHMPAEQGGKQVPCPECKRIIKVPAIKEDKPKDWRDVEKKGPSFVKPNEPVKPVGAWDVARGKVSEEALEEAGVITEPEEPRTLKERLRLPLFAAAGVGLVALVWWGYSTFASRSAQQRALDAALSYVNVKDGKPKLGQAHAAAIQRGAGEFYARARKGEQARVAFAKARAAFMQGGKTEVAPLEGDFLLADIAVSQIGMGGRDQELLDNERIDWGKTAEEVYQTLSAIDSPEVQVMALREAVRRLREHGEKGRALGLANRLANTLRGAQKGKKAGGDEPSPVLAEAAALWQEAGQAAKAAELLKAGGKGNEALALLASAVGKAMQGKLDEALKEAGGAADPLDRMQAALAVGEVALGQGKTKEASDGAQIAQTAFGELAKKKRRTPPALAVQLVRLTAHVSSGQEARQLADALTEKAARARAHLELLKRDLEQRATSGSTVGVKAVDEHVKDKDTLCYALAHEAVARHDAHQGQTAGESAETLEERLRPFVQIGIALGIQDRQQK